MPLPPHSPIKAWSRGKKKIIKEPSRAEGHQKKKELVDRSPKLSVSGRRRCRVLQHFFHPMLHITRLDSVSVQSQETLLHLEMSEVKPTHEEGQTLLIPLPPRLATAFATQYPPKQKEKQDGNKSIKQLPLILSVFIHLPAFSISSSFFLIIMFVIQLAYSVDHLAAR